MKIIMKSTQQNNLLSDNISEEINNMFLELEVNESEQFKIKYYE
jgi:hypothetical protein